MRYQFEVWNKYKSVIFYKMLKDEGLELMMLNLTILTEGDTTLYQYKCSYEVPQDKDAFSLGDEIEKLDGIVDVFVRKCPLREAVPIKKVSIGCY
ncbi:MAG: hypothetical protein AABX72_00430 [Nanoarchaeota archaeon]